MKKAIAAIITFIFIVGMITGCENLPQSAQLNESEKVAIERTATNHYTWYEVQAAALATCIYNPEMEGRDYEAHYPLRADILGVDSDVVWFGGEYGYQGKITIHVYEDHPDHTATLEWYNIDCSTWTGEGNGGDKVDLRGALAGLAVSPSWTKK